MPTCLRHVAILAHPDPNSFNAAIARTYAETVRAEGQDVILRDLYALGFDPVLKDNERPGHAGYAVSQDVRDELEVIRGADVYTFIHPVWFGMPPAILTGYIDRVIGSGVTAREVQHRAGQSVLSGKQLFSITTSGASEVWLDEQGQIEALKDLMGRYMYKAFGLRRAENLHIGGIVTGYSERFAQQALRLVLERTQRVCRYATEDALRATQDETDRAGLPHHIA